MTTKAEPSQVSPNVMSGTPLAGQVALVTGGGRGIGRAVARTLALSGASVAVLSRSREQVSATAHMIESDGGRALVCTADVTDVDAVRDAVGIVRAQLGAIDVLVNNAGANTVFGPVWEVDPKAWWRNAEVNLLGPLVCCAAVLPSMVERRKGRIVNVVSGTAGRAFPYNSAYSASKAGLVRLTDCLAAETAEHDVQVFALGPGTVMTDMALELERSESALRWMSAARANLKYIPEDFPAWAVVFLASGRADALSGRWLDSADDIAAVAARAHEVTERDLYQLRRRKD